MNTPIPPVSVPAIYHLSIERFRGIKTLSWLPSKGVNVVLGGGDVGKSTVLDAIGLLFSPTNPSVLLDTDYYNRQILAGFAIEAIVSLPLNSGINEQLKASWPWTWNGSTAVVPSLEGDTPPTGEPVYRLRVRGTEDLEYAYEVVQPNGDTDIFPVGLRRAIGLVRLGGDDRNDRDLRLVQGSALDRLLSDKGLRSRLGSELAKTDVKDELSDAAKAALQSLDGSFAKEKLPENLDLAITGSQGLSITALIGLTAQRGDVRLPLANWGAGTRRLAALAIAEQNQGEHPIALVDEIERGLEPYRQRVLIGKLQSGKSQAFVTTHSAVAISASLHSALWYVDHAGQIGPLEANKISRLQHRDPEAFLSRLTVVAEGITEVGFLTALLQRALKSTLEPHGIHICDGGGHEATLGVLETLAKGGLRFGGFADDEGKHSGRWTALAERLGSLLFRWSSGCLDENIIKAVPEGKLEALIADPVGEKTGTRLRNLADRLDIQEKDFSSIKTAAGENLKAVIVEAALGKVPAGKEAMKKEYEAHKQNWFKSLAGGRELCEKVFGLDIWLNFKPVLIPFLNAVRTAVDLPTIADLQS